MSDSCYVSCRRMIAMIERLKVLDGRTNQCFIYFSIAQVSYMNLRERGAALVHMYLAPFQLSIVVSKNISNDGYYFFSAKACENHSFKPLKGSRLVVVDV